MCVCLGTNIVIKIYAVYYHTLLTTQFAFTYSFFFLLSNQIRTAGGDKNQLREQSSYRVMENKHTDT